MQHKLSFYGISNLCCIWKVYMIEKDLTIHIRILHTSWEKCISISRKIIWPLIFNHSNFSSIHMNKRYLHYFAHTFKSVPIFLEKSYGWFEKIICSNLQVPSFLNSYEFENFTQFCRHIQEFFLEKVEISEEF